MIETGPTPDVFRIDFGKARRTRRPTFGQVLEGAFVRAAHPVVVDGHAIAQAICKVMDACTFADVQGRAWLWNEYCVFLAREDHDRLRDVEDMLAHDLLSLLNEEVLRREARMPDGFLVRLLVDEGNELVPGRGVVRVRHRKDTASAPTVAGEITMRSDRLVRAPRDPSPTDRAAGLRVVCAAGSVEIAEGRMSTLGRANPEGGPSHVALPGATGKVSRKHLSVLVDGDSVRLRREPGANPVQVDGRALADGEEVTTTLPVELALSNGDWRGTLCR
jgi:hypothetical protein